ncbi:MAG: hypothetical protein AAGF92_07035 [Myxococcota bacterium]
MSGVRKIALSLAIAAAFAAVPSGSTAQARRVELRFQGGAEVGVPIFLDVDRSIVRPGVHIAGWGGFDIGWIVFDLSLGLMFNVISTDDIIESIGMDLGDQPLIRWHFSPGIRLQVPTIERVLPYVAAAFDANLWQFEALGTNCGWYYCRSDDRFRFAPGFTAKSGVGIRIKGPWYIDVGMKYSMSAPGNFFERTQWWVEPFIGVLFRQPGRLDPIE